MAYRYEEVHPQEFLAGRARHPSVYLPIGPLEWHGHHLPYGNDALKAHALCMRTAGRIGGLVLPPLFWGSGGVGAYEPYPGTTEIETSLLGTLVHSICAQMRHNGFRVIVVLSGHGADSHMVELRRVASAFQQTAGTPVLAYGDWELALDHPYNADHAARWETSLLLALRPDLVKLDRLGPAYTAEDRLTLPWGVVRWRGEIFYQVHEGVWGEDPVRYSSAAEGEVLAERIVSELASRVSAALSQAEGGEGHD